MEMDNSPAMAWFFEEIMEPAWTRSHQGLSWCETLAVGALRELAGCFCRARELSEPPRLRTSACLRGTARLHLCTRLSSILISGSHAKPL